MRSARPQALTYNSDLRGRVIEISGFASRVASGSTELSASSEEMTRAVDDIAKVSEDLKQAGDRVARAMAGLSEESRTVVQHSEEGGKEGSAAVGTVRSAEAGGRRCGAWADQGRSDRWSASSGNRPTEPARSQCHIGPPRPAPWEGLRQRWPKVASWRTGHFRQEIELISGPRMPFPAASA
jgi:hypothetical protein